MSFFKRNATRFATRRFAPFLIALDLLRGARDHWQEELTKRQRKRALKLLRKSGGRPSKLSARQRKELVGLVKAFDPVAFAKREAKTTVGLSTGKK